MAPGLSETASISPPQLGPPNKKDQINTSLTYGFLFDMCGVEIDPDTGAVTIDRYITTHDSGKLLNPLIAYGQVYGAVAWGVGCALHEEFCYGEDGSFLSGTFADYLCPTACEVPQPEILHMESPSPFSPLGAKGIAEGNCMSTPVCIANAVSDALGVSDIKLPLSPSRVVELMNEEEPEKPAGLQRPESQKRSASRGSGTGVGGQGESFVSAPPEEVWNTLLDPDKLRAVIPGCHEMTLVRENCFQADISLGVGVVKGRFIANIELSDLEPPSYAVLSGGLDGPLGSSKGTGWITLEPADNGTRILYDYEVVVSGKVAAVGGRMIDGASKVLFKQFFQRLGAHVAGKEITPASSLLGRLWISVKRLLGMKS
jgi:2-furoyl-CoA dehydrogenase large subunit